MTDFLALSLVLLVSGLLAVPLAVRLGLGSVLGFLLAGIAIAPLLQMRGVDLISLQHFAEFGVVMMLFLIGLELDPAVLWTMKFKLLGVGGCQLVLTTLAVMVAALGVGVDWRVSLAVGVILALSSTAIVLQTLDEKGVMKSDGGQRIFSVLLFQDMAVIPLLALLPLLAAPDLVTAALTQYDTGTPNPVQDWMATRPDAVRAVLTVGAIVAVIGAGNFLTRPFFRFVAQARMRELFVATALMMMVSIALLMSLVGLSPALGAFVAGVVLANSEYKHELESNLAPFKGLLLGLFFITVGASMNFGLLRSAPLLMIGLSAGLIAIKAAVLYLIARMFKIEPQDRGLFALGLAQAGEFGFVLIALSVRSHVLPTPLADQLLLVITLSMLVTPLLFLLNDKIARRSFGTAQKRQPDDIDHSGPIIIAGHGRFGETTNRILHRAGYETVVLDHSSQHLELLRTLGFKAFFGDPTRPDLLHAAGIETAQVLIIAIDHRQQAIDLVRHVHQAHPHVHMVARAIDRAHFYELYAAGCRDIVRETLDSSVRAGRYALEAMGLHPYIAQKTAEDFIIADRHNTAELAPLYDPSLPLHRNQAYLNKNRAIHREEDSGFVAGKATYLNRVDRSWAHPRKADFQAQEKLRAAKDTTDL